MRAVLVALAVLLSPAAGWADPIDAPAEPTGENSMWREHWPTFSWVEGAATVAGGVGTLLLAMESPPAEPRWRGGVLFDDAVRSQIRLSSPKARQRVRSLGDLPYYAAPVLPLLVDPILVAWILRDDPKTAANLGLMGLEAFSYTGLLSFVSTRASRRERPDSAECRRQYSGSSECSVDTESFWSGHTSIAAASAGLVCANHQYLGLWGHPVADAAACAWATTAAALTGVSRLASDRHYATDVVAGMGVGFGLGYAVPVLLHYSRDSSVSLSVRPCAGSCVRVTGTF